MEELEKAEIVNDDLQNDEISSPDEENTELNDGKNSEVNSEAVAEEDFKVDYEKIIREDTRLLKEKFPELEKIKDISELDNPLRYAALRDLGLTPEEAYLATRKRERADNRSHLYPSPTVASFESGAVPEADMRAAREIFDDISDREIRKLYKKVTR